jgi:hypothetical protein
MSYLYISISLSIYTFSRNAICSLQNFWKNLKGAILPGQNVLTRQSPTEPDNVWQAQTMSDQARVQGYLNPFTVALSSNLSLSPISPVVDGSPLPNFISGDQRPQGLVGAFLGFTSSVGTLSFASSRSPSVSKVRNRFFNSISQCTLF